VCVGVSKKQIIFVKKDNSELIMHIYSVADLDPRSGIWCLFDPWIRDLGWVKKSGSGIQFRDEQSASHYQELRKKCRVKYLNSLMRIHVPGSRILLTLDPESGMEKIRIRDKHP
jgi:hypothetical protein